MLFSNLILSPGRYFVPFWIGEFLCNGDFLKCWLSGLSASFTPVREDCKAWCRLQTTLKELECSS